MLSRSVALHAAAAVPQHTAQTTPIGKGSLQQSLKETVQLITWVNTIPLLLLNRCPGKSTLLYPALCHTRWASCLVTLSRTRMQHCELVLHHHITLQLPGRTSFITGCSSCLTCQVMNSIARTHKQLKESMVVWKMTCRLAQAV